MFKIFYYYLLLLFYSTYIFLIILVGSAHGLKTLYDNRINYHLKATVLAILIYSQMINANYNIKYGNTTIVFGYVFGSFIV